MWNKVPHNTYCLIVVLVAPTLVMVYTLTTISHITDDVISQQDQISLLINTLPARHWRAYTKGSAHTRCLPKAMGWEQIG